MGDRKIVTNFIYPPIPLRQFDWCAHFDDEEPDDEGHMQCGYGKTEQDAIDDLLAEARTSGDTQDKE